MALPFLNSQTKRLDQIIAIDLGARTTKAVHLQRKGEGLNFLGYALQDAPAYEKGLRKFEKLVRAAAKGK